VKVISRKAAKAAGLKHYFTGKPCKFGHVEKRYVASFGCAACYRDKANQHYAALDADSRKSIVLGRRQYHREWAEQHRAQLAAYGTAYRKAYKKKHPAYFKKHYATNNEKRKSQARAWYRKNSERALKVSRAYHAAHPEQTRATGRRSANTRRATKKRVFVEVVDPRTVFTRDKGICGICRTLVDMQDPWEIDHIVPISKGGPHAYANVQLAHRKCNRGKGTRCA